MPSIPADAEGDGSLKKYVNKNINIKNININKKPVRNTVVGEADGCYLWGLGYSTEVKDHLWLGYILSL